MMKESFDEPQTVSQVDAFQARQDLEHFEKSHQWDPNLAQEKIEAVQHALSSGDSQDVVRADELLTEDSPYEEVRAAVRNADNGEVANTVRAWILGMLFVTVGAGLNMFLSMRSVLSPRLLTRVPPLTAL